MNGRTAGGSDTIVLKSHPFITGVQTFFRQTITKA